MSLERKFSIGQDPISLIRFYNEFIMKDELFCPASCLKKSL